MLFVDAEKVYREGENILRELRAQQINNHFKLLANKTSKERVDTFLKDAEKAMKKAGEEIRRIVDSTHPIYERDKKNLPNLREQERRISEIRNHVLEQVR